MACSQQLGIFRLQTQVKDDNLLEIVPDPVSINSQWERKHTSIHSEVPTASAAHVSLCEVCIRLGQREKNEDRDVSF